MNRVDNSLYREDLDAVLNAACIDWTVLGGRSIAISGATGTVGSFLTDLLMFARSAGIDVSVIALGRNEVSARKRLPYFDRDGFSFVECNITKLGGVPELGADLIVHLASTTHPRAYATQPIATITSNIIGLSNLLDQAPALEGAVSAVFASSVEVYGENRGDVEAFDESYCGYIDCNTLRAGYPESKRAGEALCQAYMSERGIGVAIPRLPRVYGPTMPETDSKAISQFIRSSVRGEDIVLKSAGTQLFTYGYISDVVTGILSCVTRGEAGRAYNVSAHGSDITLRELAELLAHIGGGEVHFDIPDAIEAAGYSKATKAILDGGRIADLGFVPRYAIAEGLSRTVEILRSFSA